MPSLARGPVGRVPGASAREEPAERPAKIKLTANHRKGEGMV
jgi:hypothetical protein